VLPSELQTCFTGGGCDRCDAAVIEVSTAVKDHSGNTFGACSLSDESTNLCCGFN
jgi:hypothetical protein